MKAILSASEERDALLGRAYPQTIVYKTLLLTGNRPGAVLAAKIGHLDRECIILPPGRGKKRNGKAFLPPAFVQEMRRYVAQRKNAGPDAPLLASATGTELVVPTASHEFTLCMTLAFVKMCWPEDDPLAHETDPHEVAHLIWLRGVPVLDDSVLSNQAVTTKRARRARATRVVAAKIGPEVSRHLERRDM